MFGLNHLVRDMLIFDIIITSDIITSVPLSTNCNLSVCIFESRHDIKNLTASSVSVPLKTIKTKFEVISPKDVDEDTFQEKTAPLRQISPKALSKIVLVIPMDPILNFLERADRELSENILLPKLVYVF